MSMSHEAVAFLATAALFLLMGTVTFAGNGLKWLLEEHPIRNADLVGPGDKDAYLTVCLGGQAIHVQAAAGTPFAPQLTLYDGVGTLVGADPGLDGDSHSEIVMQPGGTVTNLLYLYVTGAQGPAQYAVWKGAP
jgi:hypothetical protein